MNAFYYKLFLFVITSVFDQAYIPRFLIKIAFLYTYSLMAFWRIRIYFHVHCLDLFALAIVCLVVLMHQVYFLFFFNVQSMYSSSNYRDLLYSLHLTLTLISADLQIKVDTKVLLTSVNRLQCFHFVLLFIGMGIYVKIL